MTSSPERVLEIKESFVAAMERAQVPQERIDQIRDTLGIPKEMGATSDKERLGSLIEKRFKPLSRQQVRELLDQYADGGKGYTDARTAKRGLWSSSSPINPYTWRKSKR